MDSLYSKNSLLTWLTQTTNKPVKTLDELANGVHFCHLLNLLTKGQFNLAKINTTAKLQRQRLHNLKQMIYGMEKNQVMKHVDITKIASKNLNSILELLQWFRRQMSKFQKEVPDKKKMTFTVKGEIKRNKSLQKSQIQESHPINTEYFKQMKQTNFIQLLSNDTKEKVSIIEKAPLNADKHHLIVPSPQPSPIQPIHENEENTATTASDEENHPPVDVLEITSRSNNHLLNLFSHSHKEKEQRAKTQKNVLQKSRKDETSSKGKGVCSEIKNNEIVKNILFQKSELKEQLIPIISEKSISKEEKPISKQKSCSKSPGQALRIQRGENISFGISPKAEVVNYTSMLPNDKK